MNRIRSSIGLHSLQGIREFPKFHIVQTTSPECSVIYLSITKFEFFLFLELVPTAPQTRITQLRRDLSASFDIRQLGQTQRLLFVSHRRFPRIFCGRSE